MNGCNFNLLDDLRQHISLPWQALLCDSGLLRPPGESPSIKVVGEPIGNFHNKPLKIDLYSFQPHFDLLKLPKFQPLEMLRFESASGTPEKGKIIEN